MVRAIQPVVEGDGDLRAVPVLLRRILNSNGIYDLPVLGPHRRGDYPKVRAEFERYLAVAQKEQAPIIWVMDFDCKGCACVVEEVSALTERARASIGNWPLEICFMVQEFETLFLSDPLRTRAYLNIAPNVAFPANPEKIRDAKGTLSRLMPEGVTYKPTVHQASLSNAVDINHLRSASPSYAHLEKAVLSLAHAAPAQ